MHKFTLTLLAASLLLGIGSASTHADVAYTVTDLQSVPNPESILSAQAINANGTVVGYIDNILGGSVNTNAFVYSSGVMTDLGTLGSRGNYYFSRAFGINDNGQIVGFSRTAQGATHAFVYSNGAMKDLNSLIDPALGLLLTDAKGINASGQIVGWVGAGNNNAEHAFVYSSGVVQDLGTLGGFNSLATSINNSGQIVGYNFNYQNNGNFTSHAFVYSNGVMTDLGTLGGSISLAYSINNSGQIVGNSSTLSGGTHAFLYSNGVMQDLGSLGPINSNSYAWNINDNGQIVGSFYNTAQHLHAFIYSMGVMQDLNTLIDPRLGLELKEAKGINTSRQIVVDHYLLTPNVTIATAPAQVPHVHANPVPPSRIYLTWAPVIGASSYNVYRGTVSDGFHTYIGMVSNATQFSDTNVQPSTPYYYIITAVNSHGQGPKSAEVSAMIHLPGAISNLTATGYDATTVKLTWTAALDANYYRIYRSNNAGSLHTIVGSTPYTSFFDPGLSPGTSYYYIVVPANGFGYGSKSLEVTASTKVAISSISFTPSTVTGGANITGTLTLNAPAPPANAVVSITSSNPAALYVPAMAQLNSGLTSRTFTAYSRAVTTSTNVIVTATYGGVSKTTIVTVTP